MDLKRRVRSAARDPCGTHAQEIPMSGHEDDDSVNNHGHPKKHSQKHKFWKNLLWIVVVATIVVAGNEFLKQQKHQSSLAPNYHPMVHLDKTTTAAESSDSKSDSTASSSQSKLRASSSSTSSRPPLYGKMTYGIYRFKAEKLGPHFAKAIEFFDQYIGDSPDEVGFAFAKQRVAMPHVADYHQDCFAPPEQDRMLSMEQSKKSLKKESHEKRLNFLVKEQALFYEDVVRMHDPDEIAHVTADKKWAWRTAALFSTQYSGTQTEYREEINAFLQEDPYLAGGISGTFWYPPNAIREWHTNKWDVSMDHETGKMKKPWRMYYVRVKPVDEDHEDHHHKKKKHHHKEETKNDNSSLVDRSGFHLVDGNGIPPERLQELGAYKLTHKTDPTDQEPHVWRVPDQNGYVTLFRLQVDEPYRWHCIVADETVHRYSMGMSLSDESVEALLEHIGVEY